MIQGMARVLADTLNARTAQAYAQVVCTTRWAAAEFERLGVRNLRHVPLGVDLELFSPQRRCPELRRRYAAPGEVLIVHCGRLSVEKKPHLSIDALARLRAAGVPAVLVVAGDGPLRARLERRGRPELPVRFTGFLADRYAARRAAGQRRRRGRPRAGGDLRAGRPRGAGLRHAGRGQRAPARCPRWSATPGCAGDRRDFADAVVALLASAGARSGARPPAPAPNGSAGPPRSPASSAAHGAAGSHRDARRSRRP